MIKLYISTKIKSKQPCKLKKCDFCSRHRIRKTITYLDIVTIYNSKKMAALPVRRCRHPTADTPLGRRFVIQMSEMTQRHLRENRRTINTYHLVKLLNASLSLLLCSTICYFAFTLCLLAA